jgi:hypothetical protein
MTEPSSPDSPDYRPPVIVFDDIVADIPNKEPYIVKTHNKEPDIVITVPEIPNKEPDILITDPEITPESVTIPKKKPGRPAGAKSKIQGKPRAKRASISKAPPLVEIAHPEMDAEEAMPHVLQGRSIDDDLDSRILQALSQHSTRRQNLKKQLWKSWFE